MATVYSLICWGGSTGKTATMTIASPCVVTITNHGLHDGTGIVFSTTGALPTGVTAGTTYYSKSTGVNTFNLYTDSALTNIVNTSGSQSGTHTAKSAYYLGLVDKSRWTYSGTEYIYDGILSWKTARASAASYTVEEYCEIGMAFTEISTSYISISIPCPTFTLVAINNANHNGSENAGYVFKTSNTLYTAAAISVGVENSVIDGFRVVCTSTGSGVSAPTSGSRVRRMIITGTIGTANYGVYSSYGSGVEYCLVKGFKYGCSFPNSASGKFYNNTFIANDIGVYTAYTVNVFATFWNNISRGNVTTNYVAQPTGLLAGGNAGESDGSGGFTKGTPFVTGSYSNYALVAGDFADWSGGDYSPASISSPQVDVGIEYYSPQYSDLAGDEVPNYNGGGSEGRDIGAYEFDSGNGPHPASGTLQLNNIVSGSRVLITKTSDGTVLYNDVPGTSLTHVSSYIGDVDIKVRKASASTYYREFQASATIVADQTATIKCLQQTDE